MNKLTFAVLASISLLAGCVSSGSQHANYSDMSHDSGTGHEKTYVVDSYGTPVRSGEHCVVSDSNSGTYFEECDSSKMAKMQHGQMEKAHETYEPAPVPTPRVITKVIIDCAKCSY